MPHMDFYDLGEKPKKINDEMREDKITYPSLNVNIEQVPFLKDMKLGDTGTAIIKFKIDMTKYSGGIKILAIKQGMMKKEDEMTKEETHKKKMKNMENNEGGEY